MTFDPRMFNDILVDQSLVGRLVADRENPYMTRVQQVSPDPAAKVSVLSRGAATVRQADDGGAVLADLGVLTATEAGRVAATVNASGAGSVAAVAVGVM